MQIRMKRFTVNRSTIAVEGNRADGGFFHQSGDMTLGAQDQLANLTCSTRSAGFGGTPYGGALDRRYRIRNGYR